MTGGVTKKLGDTNFPTGVAVDQPVTQVKQGATVTLTATVISSPPGSYPAGKVKFTDGGTLLGTATLTAAAPADTATFSTTALAPGTHTITASYEGSSDFPASTSVSETVDVYSSTVVIGVTGAQTYGGSTVFSDAVPTTHPGVTVTGTLTGCSSTVTAATPVSTYHGTISGCSGLSLTGSTASTYHLVYADDGVTVKPATLPVTIDATRVYGATTTFSPAAPTLPTGVTAVSGSVAGCTTTEPATKGIGHYTGTFSGCGGLSLTGPKAADYAISYVDGGLTITKAPVTVSITGSQAFGGTATFVDHPQRRSRAA